MPIDPETGEELPYEDDKKKKGEEGPEMSFDEDIKPVLDAADAILAEGEEPPVEGEEPPVEGGEGVEPTAEGVSLSSIEDALKENNPELSDEEAAQQAKELWDAAGQRDDLAALSPDDLAAQLKEDPTLLIQLKKIAAQGAPEGEMEEPPVGPPMGGPPMGGPPMGPGGMMPGGM